MKAYQVKITVKGSHPPIWRRCIIPAGITFSQLGVLFNEIMGWKGYHLFMFRFHDLGICVEEIDEDYGDPYYELEEATETQIDPYMERVKWFTYCYDFGDDWEHRVDVESVIPDSEYTHPVVLKAKGACPFEDCGGIGGYYDFLEAIRDPENEEHEDICGWAEATGYMEDGEYDPSYYDIEGTNKLLESCFQVRFVKKPDESDANTLYEKLLMGERGTFDAVQKGGKAVTEGGAEETDGYDGERREADLEEWRALYEAAMRLKEIKPWETFWDMDLITLEGEWEDEVFVSILGKGGDCYGISVYEGLDGLNDFMLLTLSEKMNLSSEYAMFSQNNLTCYWGNREELTREQWQTVKDLGYKFRGKNQWLYFLSYQRGYFPYNMDKSEVLRMTGYLKMLADAVEYYRKNEIKVDFEHENTYFYSADGDEITAGELPLPFTGCNFPVLTLTDENLLEDLRKSEKCNAVLEADIAYTGAAVMDERYQRPANPCLCLVADAHSGLMLKAEMAGPEKDAGVTLAEALIGFIFHFGAPKEIRVGNVIIEATLEQICRESGIRLRRVKKLKAIEEFRQEMQRFGY